MTPALNINVMSHPLRPIILAKCRDEARSPSDIAREVGASLGVVSYHVRVLESHGLLRLVKKVPRRGATEHYYKMNAQRVDVLRERLEFMAGALG